MLDGLSPMHLLLVLGVVLIVFGPGRMPEVGAALGKSLRELRSALRDQDRPAEPPVISTTDPKPPANPPVR
jgi:sec-independent protein translocase protein TatA